MKRKCSCQETVRSETCAVHSLWDRFVAPMADGEALFSNIAPNFARSRLRQLLAALGVANAGKYATHDFRRGHAQDLLESGVTLAQILVAGQWRSASFLKYLKEAELERDVAFAVSIESDDDD